MGLFDWMTGSVGSSSLFDEGTPMQPGLGAKVGDLDPMGNPTGQMSPMPVAAPAPTGPMPDVNGPGMDAPMATEGAPAPPALGQMPPPPPEGLSLPPGMGPPPANAPYPQGGDPMDGSGMNAGPGLPAPPGLPQPKPPTAAPPAAAPTDIRSRYAPPVDAGSAVRSYEAAGGSITPPAGGPQAQSILGRALGLDPNRESQLRGTLAAGFKAAGESAGKSPGQAFSSGVGAGIEGGKKADDKTTEQQDKYLQRAIQAKREGNQAAYQQNYLRYQIEATKARLAQAKEKAAGKDSVMNSREQLYLRAIGATNADGELKILAAKAREAEKMGDEKASKAAMDAYNARRQQILDGHLGTLGISPADVKGLGDKPGFSEKTPFKTFDKDPAKAQKQFDELPDGAYFINPKDGRLLTKKSAGGGAQANPAQPVSAAPPMQPPMPPMPMSPGLNTMAMAEDY